MSEKQIARNVPELNKALLSAIRNDESLATIRRLIRDGAEVNHNGFLNQTPLIAALSHSSGNKLGPLVSFLIESGADVTLAGSSGHQPLQAAAKCNNPRVFLMVIETLRAADKLTMDMLGTELQRSVSNNHIKKEIIEILLDSGAPVQALKALKVESLAVGVFNLIQTHLALQTDNPAEHQNVAATRLNPTSRGLVP